MLAAGSAGSLEAFEGLVHGFLDAGAAGVVALGTTAEAAALEKEEKEAVVGVCAKACAERSAQLIVGAGTNNTAASVAAVEDTRLFRLDREAFAELMAGNIEIVRGVLHVLCERLRALDSYPIDRRPLDRAAQSV